MVRERICKILHWVNENALIVLFGKEGIKAVQQAPIKVKFENEIVGNYLEFWC